MNTIRESSLYTIGISSKEKASSWGDQRGLQTHRFHRLRFSLFNQVKYDMPVPKNIETYMLSSQNQQLFTNTLERERKNDAKRITPTTP